MIETLLILSAITLYFALQYNFIWFLGLVVFNLIFAKSVALKLILVLVPGLYCYEAVDYYAAVVHRAPLTFDLLKARSK